MCNTALQLNPRAVRKLARKPVNVQTLPAACCASRCAKDPKATARSVTATWRCPPASCWTELCSKSRSTAAMPAGVWRNSGVATIRAVNTTQLRWASCTFQVGDPYQASAAAACWLALRASSRSTVFIMEEGAVSAFFFCTMRWRSTASLNLKACSSSAITS